MPKSRGRAGRPTHDKIRARRRAQHQRGDASAIAAQACAAFDRADPELALRRLRSVPRLAQSSWADELEELVAAGTTAPAWLWCRATLAQAYRSVCLDDMETVRVTAASIAAGTYEYQDADQAAMAEMMRHAMAVDEFVRDAVLFDAGALARYLETRASAALLARIPVIKDWARAERSVFELGALEHDTLVVTDLVSGHRHTVLHLGAAAGLAPSDRVLGRLAAIDEEPGQIFVSRPQYVDDVSARRLVRRWSESAEPDAMRDPFPTLSEAVASGRMPSAPGLWAGAMSLASDLPPVPVGAVDDDTEGDLDEEDGPRVRELVESGLSPMDARHVVVVEMALLTARVTPDLLPVVAAHAAIALAYPRVRDAVRTQGTAADAPHWRMIAACVQDPVRRFCLEMAGLDAA
jgi:hypothetical protein